jgi:microcystin-dependent protein
MVLSLTKKTVEDLGLPVGVVFPYAYGAAPSGYLLCDGAAVSRTTYAALFALVGTTYGAGDTVTTFNVPNLKGRVVAGFDAGQSEFNTIGETGGSKTHTLTVGEMPSHTHPYQLFPNSFGGNNPYPGQAGIAINTTVGATGGDGAHNNLQPYMAMNYIIKT